MSNTVSVEVTKAEPLVLQGITVTHPERVISEIGQITKGQLAEYYSAVASRMLPQIALHPLSLLRLPVGESISRASSRGTLGKVLGRMCVCSNSKTKRKRTNTYTSRTKEAYWRWFKWAPSNFIHGARRLTRSIVRTA